MSSLGLAAGVVAMLAVASCSSDSGADAGPVDAGHPGFQCEPMACRTQTCCHDAIGTFCCHASRQAEDGFQGYCGDELGCHLPQEHCCATSDGASWECRPGTETCTEAPLPF